MSDVFDIAMWSRLYSLLAERQEFSRSDLGERIAVTSDESSLGGLDRTLIERSTELDRLCGYAVRILRRDGKPTAILDLLGTLEPDRVLAIYFALPTDRRKAVVRWDPVFAYYVERAPEGVDEVGFRLDEFDLSDDEPIPVELERFRRERRRYKAGLPHDLTTLEMDLVDGTV